MLKSCIALDAKIFLFFIYREYSQLEKESCHPSATTNSVCVFRRKFGFCVVVALLGAIFAGGLLIKVMEMLGS
jgi:hypothetical protein